MLRDSPAQIETKPKADSSSESSEESLDKMAETMQQFLNKKDAEDVKKIVSNINSGKDVEQTVDNYVRPNTICKF